MVRYIIADIEEPTQIARYVKAYLPATESCPIHAIQYTPYRHKAQIFTEEEAKKIPNSVGKMIKLEM